ncbi:MAG: nickel-binding protein [Candidatus Limnocylindrales bacterium]
MPLYMDRHDLPGVTAEEVAQAHVTDIAIEADFGVHFLAYWFDADHQEAFCLATAPGPAAMQGVHRAGHGLVPNEIIAVSEDEVLRFLGRVADPADHGPVDSAFRTILFTDLEGSTSLLQQVGERAFMALLAEHDTIIRRSLVTWRGREVKHTGDGIMASFDDLAGALECSMGILAGFETRVADGAARALRVRIGIAAGEPVDHNDDLFGSTVNLARRICDAAEAGHVFVSDVVRDMGTERGFAFGERLDLALKGFGVVPVFELMPAAIAHTNVHARVDEGLRAELD